MSIKRFFVHHSNHNCIMQDPKLEEIKKELKHLKRQRKSLTPSKILPFTTGAFFMGASMIPTTYYTSTNNQRLSSLDRNIDRLEETIRNFSTNSSHTNLP